MENCQHYITKNIDKYFVEIFSGKLPQDLAIEILKSIDIKNLLTNQNLVKFIDYLENNKNFSSDLRDLIVPKIENSWLWASQQRIEISKEKFDNLRKDSICIDNDGNCESFSTIENEYEYKITNDFQHILYIEKDKISHRIPLSIYGHSSLFINTKNFIFAFSKKDYYLIYIPISYFENKLSIKQNIFVNLLAYFYTENRVNIKTVTQLNSLDLLIVDKLLKSKTLEELPTNEAAICRNMLSNREKELLNIYFKAIENSRTNLFEFILLLQYCKLYDIDTIIKIISHLPVRIKKMLIKELSKYFDKYYPKSLDLTEFKTAFKRHKLTDYKASDPKNIRDHNASINIMQNDKNLENKEIYLFSMAYCFMDMESISEYRKQIDEKFDKVLKTIMKQDDLDKEKFKGYLINLLEELAVEDHVC